ncbi:MAG: hypothetical protein U0Z44_12880 [Kouleothrix sp.]
MPPRRCAIPARWACFREHAGGKTIARQAQAAPEVLAIYRRLFADPALPAIAALEREATAGALVFAANSLFMAGQLRAARSYALRGMGQAAPRARVLARRSCWSAFARAWRPTCGAGTARGCCCAAGCELDVTKLYGALLYVQHTADLYGSSRALLHLLTARSTARAARRW